MSRNTDATIRRAAIILSLLVLLSACATHPHQQRDSAPDGHLDIDNIPDAVPRAEPPAKRGNPDSYVVFGQRYYPIKSNRGFVETGIASWYGTKFHGRLTSSGEPYNMYAMTAAHKTLPLPTYVEVTNLENGKKVVVKVNDRGPFHENRIIDLSYAAAMKLGYGHSGTARVKIRAIDPTAPEEQVIQPKSRPTPPGTATHGKTLYLQVGSFSSRPNAETLQQLIASMTDDMPVKIFQVSQAHAPHNPLFRVKIGPLSSSEEAERTSTLLTMLGITNSHVVYD